MDFYFEEEVVMDAEDFEPQTPDEENRDLVLLSLVERYTCLYDKTDPQYKNKIAKENAWISIASAMGASIAQITKDFTRLRRRFTAERRIQKAPPKSGSAYRPVKQWPLYNSMKFLEPFVVPRQTHANMKFEAETTLKKSSWTKGIAIPQQSGLSQRIAVTSSPLFLSQSVPQSSSPSLLYKAPSHSNNPLPTSISTESLIAHHISTPSISSTRPSTPGSPGINPSSSGTSLAIRSNALASSGMASPDPFHARKKVKAEGMDAIFKDSLDSVNKNISAMIGQRRDSGSSSSSVGSTSDRHFANYLCEIMSTISSDSRKRACHQKLLAVVDEFLSSDETNK